MTANILRFAPGYFRSALIILISQLLVVAQTGGFHGGVDHTGVYEAAVGRFFGGIQWRFQTDGDVVASPVRWRETVYIGSGDGNLYALSLDKGEKKWSFDAGSPISSTVSIGEGTIYFGTRDGRLHAVDAVRGLLKWQFKTSAEVPLIWGHESGDYYTSSPAYDSGLVVFGAGDGNVYAVSAKDGKQRWHAQTGGRVRSSPAISAGRVFVGSMDGRIYCFDLKSGRQLWNYETEGASLNSADFGFDRRTLQSSPTVATGTIYIGSRDGGLYALDTESGHLRWRASHGTSWIITTPAVIEGTVYVASSDAAFVQALDASSGKELWRHKIGTVMWSSPAISGDTFYLGDRAGRMLAIDRSSGNLRWTFRSSDSIFSSPIVVNGMVIFGSTDGGVYALRISTDEIKRVVFSDPAFTKQASFNSERLTTYLEHRSYQVVHASELISFLRERVEDRLPSVVVFGTDDAPPEVVSASTSCLLRRYLDAGGKVVWPGVPPLLWPVDPETKERRGYKTVDWNATANLLGVDHGKAIFDGRGVVASLEGLRWGMAAHLARRVGS